MTIEERIALSRKQSTPARRLAFFFAPDFQMTDEFGNKVTWKIPVHAIAALDENYRRNEQYRLNLDKWGANPLWSAVAHALCADLQNREKATDDHPYVEAWWCSDEQPKTPEEIYREMAKDDNI